MKIALLSHVRHPIAPPFKGGMEAHSWHLAAGLARRGHDVTLFASGDSAATLPRGVTLEPILPAHYDADFPWHRFHGTEALNAHVDAGFEQALLRVQAGRFDVVHNNSLHRYPPRMARSARLPMVTSLHVPPFDALRRAVHESAAPWAHFTVTSRRQRQVWWPEAAPAEAHVAWNGIDPADWPYAPGGDGSAVWAGRITATKGPHLAAAAAARAGLRLRIFGAVEDQAYFDAELAPLLSSCITWEGHLDGPALAAAYARASVLLFTPCWEEPFGLAAIEGMATGLPVAAFDRGAAREVVGPAGAFAAAGDVGGLARALRAALTLDPQVARNRVLSRFTHARMLERYEALYTRARAGLADAQMPYLRFPPIELPHRVAEPLPA